MRTETLATEIRQHRAAYYNDQPLIPDDEFDALVDELRDLDPDHPALFEVGAPVEDDSHWEVVEHTIPMTSLDKVNTKQELHEWLAQRPANSYCVQEKLDGISISVEYRDGKLFRAVTRGGGLKGEDITRNVRRMQGIPSQVTLDFDFTLRGEIVMLDEDFEEYNRVCVQRGWRDEPYKNSRNGASGTSRRLDGKGCEYLTAMFYEIYPSNLDGDVHNQYRGTKIFLNAGGFKMPFFAEVVSAREIEKIYDEYEATKREALNYEIDGLVIKVNETTQARQIEEKLQTSTRRGKNPKSQVAWKFSAETRKTTLMTIVGNLGLGGRVTPVAILEPVQIGGVTVRRASLHNWDMVKELDLKIGCEVLIKRANDVIPQVVRRTNNVGSPVSPPRSCPGCKSPLVRDGKFLECRNTSCDALLMGTLRRWIQKLEVKFFGMKIIEGLVDHKAVKDIADLYDLSVMDIEAVSSGGVAKRAFKNLHADKDVPLNIMIGSLGIKGFGRSLARMMVEAGYDTVDKMLNATHGEIAAIDQFGEERADVIVNGLKANETVIRKLQQRLNLQEGVRTVVIPSAAGPLEGKSFCITGKLSQPKKVYETVITANGGIWEKRVGKGLDFLVAADPGSGSSKMVKAEKMGIKVISEDDLLKMIAN